MQIEKIFLVARYTAREVIRSNVLASAFLLGILLSVISLITAEFAYGSASKVAIDFGLGVLNLSSIGIAIFMGISLVANEIETRTILMVMCRPVSRSSFILGKVLGLSSILFLNIIIMSVFTIMAFTLNGGALSPVIFWCIFFSFLESNIIMVITVFFSLITNNVMAVIYSILTYIIGSTLGNVLKLSEIKNFPALKILSEIASLIFPNVDKLNIRDYVIYKQHLDGAYLYPATLYAAIYFFAVLILCILIFRRRNIQ